MFLAGTQEMEISLTSSSVRWLLSERTEEGNQHSNESKCGSFIFAIYPSRVQEPRLDR